MKPEDSVSSLKEMLEGVSGIPVQHQLLIHNGKELASRCAECIFFLEHALQHAFCVVQVRQGVLVESMTPQPLHEYALEGLKAGVYKPMHVHSLRNTSLQLYHGCQQRTGAGPDSAREATSGTSAATAAGCQLCSRPTAGQDAGCHAHLA